MYRVRSPVYQGLHKKSNCSLHDEGLPQGFEGFYFFFYFFFFIGIFFRVFFFIFIFFLFFSSPFPFLTPSLQKEYERAMNVDANNGDVVRGYSQTLQKIQETRGDKDRSERALQDPEIQEILREDQVFYFYFFFFFVAKKTIKKEEGGERNKREEREVRRALFLTFFLFL